MRSLSPRAERPAAIMAGRAAPGLSSAHVIGSAVTHSAARDDASLSLTSRTDRSGYVIGALRGELGIASAPALREQLLSLLRAASQLIIDLSAVERADASGLAVLVGSGRRARLLGGSLRLAAPSPEVARVLSATGMNQHLDIFPTVRAAITGKPELPEAIFPSATVPARGRIDSVIAAAAAQSTMPATDLADGPCAGSADRAWRVSSRPRALPARSYPRVLRDRPATTSGGAPPQR
jgi:anti-anti-sigma factor